MKTKNASVASLITLVFFLLVINSVLAADSHDDYYSLHEEQVVIIYQDEIGLQQKETRQGFLEMYDIEDSKIACQSALPCYSLNNDETIALPTIILGTAGIMPPSSKKNKFRVFIPEGAMEIKLTMYCTQSALLSSVIKFNDIPDCVQCSQNFNNISFTKEDTFPFSTFETNETYLQNAGGHINVYTKVLQPPDATGKNPPWSNGGWLYINNFNQSDTIGQIQFGMKVHKETFQNWYTSYKSAVDTDPANDVFGLLSGSTVVPGDPGTTPPPSNGETDLSVSVTGSTGDLPLQVIFTPTISNGTGPYSFTWNFGDGATSSSTASTTSHTYDTEGSYWVTLTITDQAGNTAVATTLVTAGLQQPTYDDGYKDGLAQGTKEGYDEGKQYCIDHPVDCGIITIQDDFKLILHSVESIADLPGGPWNIHLMFNNGVWELENIENKTTN